MWLDLNHTHTALRLPVLTSAYTCLVLGRAYNWISYISAKGSSQHIIDFSATLPFLDEKFHQYVFIFHMDIFE